jgi:hypothetical protein
MCGPLTVPSVDEVGESCQRDQKLVLWDQVPALAGNQYKGLPVMNVDGA